MKPKTQKRMTADDQRTFLENFILNFEDFGSQMNEEIYQKYGQKKYLIQMQMIADKKSSTIEVFLEDLESSSRKDEEKAVISRIRSNTMHYIRVFEEIIHKHMPERLVPINPENEIRHKIENILRNQRMQNILESQEKNLISSEDERLPSKLYKDYQVLILEGTKKKKIHSISDLKADLVGSLLTLKAIVVRVSQAKPRIEVATYACEICGFENYQELLDDSFRPLTQCMSPDCKFNQAAGKLTLIHSHSKFTSYQLLKIQETADQLKEGRVPKVFYIALKGAVSVAAPGDIIEVEGVLESERQKYRGDNPLCFNASFEALKITREKKRYEEMSVSEEMREKIEEFRKNNDDDEIISKLARSIAPQIYGMNEVKTALLLQMAGGVTKETQDNLRIRGEINVALIGDPGIAKSQLLKHISKIAPRAIYTTGKGSSGVGLTAAVVSDPVTKQLSLEAGALVLADMGICCIDEFDKMDEYDRTAIHEVMEQQTVSIAKAGIVTTLNARTSVLAAANPLYGRYNAKETPHKNINMPAALLSRFDLVFVLLDKHDPVRDLNLARHIGQVHRTGESKSVDALSSEFLRTYVSFSKAFSPIIPVHLHEQIIERYIAKRRDSVMQIKAGETYVTTRTLLALLRLSQARARLRFSNEISRQDILESELLIAETVSGISNRQDVRQPREDVISSIYTYLKNYLQYSEDNEANFQDIQQKVISQGYSEQDFELTVTNYELMGLLMKHGNTLRLVE